MKRGGALLIGVLSLCTVPPLTACNDGGFLCSNDAACGSAGRCDANGFCAFEESACASGWSYGQNATADLAGTCVPASDGGSTSMPPPGPMPSEDRPADTDTDTDTGSTGEAPFGSTGDPPDGSTSSDDNSSGDAAVLPCGSLLLHATPRGWEVSEDAGGTHLRFEDDALAFDMGLATPSYASLAFETEIDATDSQLTARIDSWLNETGPGVAGAAQVGVEWVSEDGSAAARVFTTAGSVFAQIKVPQLGVQQPTQLPRSGFPLWVRLREHGGVLHWESSSDGHEFDLLHATPTPVFVQHARAGVFGGTWQALPSDFQGPSVAVVGALSSCGPARSGED